MPKAEFLPIADRVKIIQSQLDALYPKPPIPLTHEDPFTLLVAVVLSAQTTDAMVNRVTPALFAKAKTPQAMAQLSVPEIHAFIRTCGLAPQKAKALQGLSKLILEKHGGQVPRTFEELEELPGVGHKTASVVMTQAFGVPAFPVDTHIHRLAQRWGLSSGKNVEKTEADLKKLFPESTWNKLHLQIIYYGRSHCSARGCDGTQCPICQAVRKPAKAKAASSKSKHKKESKR